MRTPTETELLDFIDAHAELLQDRHPDHEGGVLLILRLQPLPGMIEGWTVGAPNDLRTLLAGQAAILAADDKSG